MADHFRLLIAEDNADLADTVEMLFSEYGYDVETCPDGESALSAALADPPAAAVLDIGLPRMDGYELARRLRAELPGRRMLLVAVTAYGSEADHRRAIEAGFDCFFAKPADPDELLRVLAAYRDFLAAGTACAADR
jgi:DNA-binding response OmpR family regulator